MIKIIVFLLLSIPVVIFSWRSLSRLTNHGFYRFLAWECILWLAINNIRYWFDDPFSFRQIVSWIFLFYCIYPATAGAILMKKLGKPNLARDGSLYSFEKTTELIEAGVFKTIRHPLYSSLLFLTWGIFLKHITLFMLVFALLSTVFLFATALMEEKENIAFFGEKYRDYIKRTKMFIPYIV
jgi:protein-S-isoprenylcysteine O-methyltransferase Ste14